MQATGNNTRQFLKKTNVARRDMCMHSGPTVSKQ